jgi:hypothetical protein
VVATPPAMAETNLGDGWEGAQFDASFGITKASLPWRVLSFALASLGIGAEGFGNRTYHAPPDGR